jgi:YD repeat-containing protein
MKTIFSILFVVSFYFSANAQQNRKQLNLYGNVKSVNDTTFKALTDGKSVRKGARSSNHPVEPVIRIYRFDKEGRQTDYINENQNGKRTRLGYSYTRTGKVAENLYHEGGMYADGSKLVYTYDAEGNKIDERVYTNNILVSDWKYIRQPTATGTNVEIEWSAPSKQAAAAGSEVYDKKGRLIEKRNANRQLTYSYFYDSINRRTEEQLYRPPGTAEVKYVYGFDTTGKEIENFSYDANGSLIVRHEFAYDSSGHKTRYDSYDKYGKLTSSIRYEYDAYGNVLQESYHSNGETEIWHKYSYTYDKQGNWISRIRYEEGQPAYITERTIVYY